MTAQDIAVPLRICRPWGSFCLGLLLLGCQGRRSDADQGGEILAWVDQRPIYASVVRDIAKRQGIDQEQALSLAADTLRLYLSYQEQPSADEHRQDTERFLTLQGAVRVWLQDSFEPEHGPAQIPSDTVKETLEKVARKGRPFGPKLHGLCQIIVRPKDAQAQDDARSIPGFESEARKLIADMDKNLRRALPELKAADRCKGFDQLTDLIAVDRPQNIVLKREALLLDLKSKSWDSDFVEKVRVADEPQLLPAFMTKFGLHLVFVSQVLPAHLAAQSDGSIDPQTQREREQEMRDLMLLGWQSKQMKALLETLRKRELIEWTQP